MRKRAITFPIIHSMMRKVIHCQSTLYACIYCFGQKAILILEVAIRIHTILYYKSDYYYILAATLIKFPNIAQFYVHSLSFLHYNRYLMVVYSVRNVKMYKFYRKLSSYFIYSISLYHKTKKTNHGQL